MPLATVISDDEGLLQSQHISR